MQIMLFDCRLILQFRDTNYVCIATDGRWLCRGKFLQYFV